MSYIHDAMRTNSPNTGTFDTLTPDLLHATLGMCDEHFEYNMARSWLNAVEELGDFCWFIALAAHTVKTDPFEYWETFIDENPDAPMLQEALASFVTLVKKSYAYGALFDLPQARYLLHVMAGRIAKIAVTKGGRQPDELLAANIKKLKARFPDKFEQHLALVRDVKQEAAALRAELG
jgi:hypothetical protein